MASPVRANSMGNLPAAGATPVGFYLSQHNDTQNTTVLLAGTKLEPFYADTAILKTISPYFTNLAHFNDESSQHHPDLSSPYSKKADANPLAGPFSFPEFDEFAVALFTKWLHDEKCLHGPHDFHSLNHYLCLYALGRRFGIESLQNQVMDAVRHYYSQEQMTAPPFRLDYIYANTSGPNKMKDFLVATAAYRVLSKGLPESDSVGYTFKQTEPVSDSLKGVLRGGGDVAPDFVDKLILLARNDMEDPRKGDDCKWEKVENPSESTEANPSTSETTSETTSTPAPAAAESTPAPPPSSESAPAATRPHWPPNPSSPPPRPLNRPSSWLRSSPLRHERGYARSKKCPCLPSS